MWPFYSAPEPVNPIEEVDLKDTGGMLCIKCGVMPQTMVNDEGLYYCTDCHEAKERRERFESEEHLWSDKK